MPYPELLSSLLPPLVLFPIAQLRPEFFQLMKNSSIDCIAFLTDFLLSNQFSDCTSRFSTVETISEAAVSLQCFFKTGEVEGQIENGYIHQAKIDKAGRIDKLSTISE